MFLCENLLRDYGSKKRKMLHYLKCWISSYHKVVAGESCLLLLSFHHTYGMYVWSRYVTDTPCPYIMLDLHY